MYKCATYLSKTVKKNIQCKIASYNAIFFLQQFYNQLFKFIKCNYVQLQPQVLTPSQLFGTTPFSWQRKWFVKAKSTRLIG